MRGERCLPIVVGHPLQADRITTFLKPMKWYIMITRHTQKNFMSMIVEVLPYNQVIGQNGAEFVSFGYLISS